MEQKNPMLGEYGRTILGWAILSLILISYFGLMAYYDDKDIIETTNAIPDWDHNKEPFYFDYHKDKWVYKGERTKGRANGFKEQSSNKDDVEDLIQEKLEKGVDGYIEDTYWGSEYDLNDKEE